MTFKELIQVCNFYDVIKYAMGLHTDPKPSLADAYLGALFELRATDPATGPAFPASMNGYRIEIQEGKQPQVELTHDTKEPYAVDGSNWEELLAMPVYTPFDSVNKTVGYILWEITFWGFSNKSIQERLGSLLTD